MHRKYDWIGVKGFSVIIMLKKYLYIGLLLFAVKTIPAQINLVPNPSFEDTLQCPFNPGQIAFASPWYDPTLGSPDYFNSCNSGNYGVPNNVCGSQLAKTGKAYAGLYSYYSGFNAREYIQTQLYSPLVKGKNYCAEFYVSLADTFSVSSNNMGMYFSDTAISTAPSAVLNVIPQINNDTLANSLFNKINWTKISGSFTAQGGEQFITIGNFLNDMTTDTTNVAGGTFAFSYYYIDDVSVICCDCNDTILIPNVFTPNNDGVNDFFKIKNLPDNVSIQIYNRWGIKVFETNRSNIFWDGRTTSGNESVDGTYFYIIITEEKTYKGYLQLIH